jgi:hypothetical protein
MTGKHGGRLKTNRALSRAHRRHLFDALVALQDCGASPGESRLMVANDHHLRVGVVRAIEVEGLAHDWPLPYQLNERGAEA